MSRCHLALNISGAECGLAFPEKLADYLAAGLPIVNSLPGEVQHLLEEAGAGVFYSAGSAGSLAAAVEELLGDVERHLACGRAARILARTHFDEQLNAACWTQFILEAV